MNILEYFRIVPDFPKPGIQFYDISTLINTPEAFSYVIDQMADKISAYNPDKLIGLESRGFLLTPVAVKLGLPFGMIRKPGKLPGEIIEQDYELEYGSDKIQLQPDLITEGSRIVLIDDLLATGGTLEAGTKLIRKAGAEIAGAVCIIELEGLPGRERLQKLDVPFEALVTCPADPPESDYKEPLAAV